MTHSEAERKGLVSALGLLASGACSSFEYELWVVFGDRWTKVRAGLEAQGAIRETQGDSWVLTEAGEATRRSLEAGAGVPAGQKTEGAKGREALSGSISGGEPSRDALRSARVGRPRAAVEGSGVG